MSDLGNTAVMHNGEDSQGAPSTTRRRPSCAAASCGSWRVATKSSKLYNTVQLWSSRLRCRRRRRRSWSRRPTQDPRPSPLRLAQCHGLVAHPPARRPETCGRHSAPTNWDVYQRHYANAAQDALVNLLEASGELALLNVLSVLEVASPLHLRQKHETGGSYSRRANALFQPPHSGAQLPCFTCKATATRLSMLRSRKGVAAAWQAVAIQRRTTRP